MSTDALEGFIERSRNEPGRMRAYDHSQTSSSLCPPRSRRARGASCRTDAPRRLELRGDRVLSR